MLTERQFQAQVLDLARLFGWLCYHTYDSRRCAPGYPDLALCHPQRGYVLAELKTDKGRLKPAQRTWIEALRAAGVEVCVWRPRDFEAIVERLCSTSSSGHSPTLSGSPSMQRVMSSCHNL